MQCFASQRAHPNSLVILIIRIEFGAWIEKPSFGDKRSGSVVHGYLISAFPIYGHYRWALARNILFVADYAHLQNPVGPVDPARINEPREIVEASFFKASEREAA